MTNLLLSGATLALPTPQQIIHGEATYMAPGRMRAVLVSKAADLTGYAGPVALNRAGDLGRTVWLESEDGAIDGPMLVVDCAGGSHGFATRERQGRVAEVGAGLAKRRGFYAAGPVPVTVRFVDPATFPQPF